MSINDLKDRLRDVPGIENLTMRVLLDRQTFGWNGLIARVDLNATDAEIEDAIRKTAAGAESPLDPIKAALGELLAPYTLATPLPPVNITEPKPMSAQPTSFAASIRAMMDEARAGVEKAKTDGLAQVSGAIGKMNEAKAATAKVAGSMAKTIEDEAASVLSELGQISNSLGEND